MGQAEAPRPSTLRRAAMSRVRTQTRSPGTGRASPRRSPSRRAASAIRCTTRRTLTGATANAGGSVTYSVYTDTGCSLGKQDGGTKTVTNGVVPDSNGIQFNSAGTFYWQAVYSGDSNNNGATSACTSEKLVINPNSPTMSTAQNLIPNDSATLSGLTSNAGGSVT